MIWNGLYGYFIIIMLVCEEREEETRDRCAWSKFRSYAIKLYFAPKIFRGIQVCCIVSALDTLV